MDDEFIAELKSMMKDVKEIKTTVNNTDAKLAGFTKRMDEVESQNKELKKTCDNLQDKVNDLDQYSRIENVIINGIPQKDDENIRQVVTLVAEKLNVTLHECDISTAHRLPSKPDRIPAIIVRLNNRDKKSELVINSRKLRINSKDINLMPAAPIFVNEHLTSKLHKIELSVRDCKNPMPSSGPSGVGFYLIIVTRSFVNLVLRILYHYFANKGLLLLLLLLLL
ncbi:uncharacterized protein LOC135834071 [Planococcus citri]|uniref:uncharacterized protein LOC135834071 n=1 Tax=Planococcus citri TaxID=170843 RepID=UPI0031F8F5B6